MSIFTEVRELKAKEDFEAAWQKGFTALSQEPGNVYLQTVLFWVIYAALKKLIEPITHRDIKNPQPREQRLIDEWASRISMLGLSFPNENIDFRIWNLFRDVGKFCEPVCIFILRGGSSIFGPDDHNPYLADKGESPSLVVRLARMTAHCYLMKGLNSQLPVGRVLALIRYAQDKTKDSPQGKVWLEYDRGKILLAGGQIEKAREAYLSVLRNKRTESWAWFGLASTYKNETETALSLVSKGLTACAHDPKFGVSGLMQMAELFASEGDYVHASMALIRLNELYQANGWPLKERAIELMSSAWFDGALASAGLDGRIRTLAAGADQYAIAKPATYYGVVQSIHESGKGATIYINKDLPVLSAKKSSFKNPQLFKVGEFVKTSCDIGSERPDVLSVEATPALESGDICSFAGALKVSEKGFGFVDNIFVPPSLIKEFNQSGEVEGLAIMAFDKLKEKHSWRAITITPASGPAS